MNQRSRKGCHTCKRRHKKCDEARPFCERCIKGGFQCDGYGIRLTWGQENGDAQHGIIINPIRQKRVRTANSQQAVDTVEPIENAICADLDDLGPQYSFSQWELDIISQEPSYNSPTSEDATEKRLMDAFVSHGHLALTGRVASENLLISEVVPMSEHCLPLRNVCMAYQASLEDDKELTGIYLERGLYGYYSNLFQHDELVKDSTLATGVLLCSVSISASYIWTPLLRGLNWILETRGLLASTQRPKLAAHLMEVIGLLDLECFVLGATVKSMELWRKHIAPFTQDRIEQSSGLPYVLVNLVSELQRMDTEQQLVRWPGLYTSEFALLHLWEAFRSAAVLQARMLSSGLSLHDLPHNEVLIIRTLSSIQALRDAKKEGCSPHLADHVVYPLFLASIASKQDTPERRLVIESWQVLFQSAERQKNQLCYDIVLEVWKRLETRDKVSPWVIANEFARELNIEFYLS